MQHLKKNDLYLSTSIQDCPSQDISWIPLNPTENVNELINKYPKFKYTTPITVTVIT